MANNIYIAGTGVISSIGNNVADSFAALAAGQSGIAPIQYLQTAHKQQFPVGEVKLSNAELAQLSGFPAHTSRTIMLSYLAAKEALLDAGIEAGSGLRVGFISANTVGGMDKTEDFFADFMQSANGGRLRSVVDHECGATTVAVADRLGIRHHISTISTACSSSANAIMYAARLIKHNLLDVAVAGGADALTRFTLNGFNTLMILDSEYSQPFDANRRGLNLGEGAGYITLVSERMAQSLGKKPYALLSGYSNANDVYHQTASSPDGAGSYQAMAGALAMAGLQPQQIGYINLHGTGTPNNDSSEGAAIGRLFGPQYPQLSSTKAYTGHTLGASAGVEAVFSVLALQHGVVYPNLRLATPIAEHAFVPQTTFSQQPNLQHVLSNSFGFGGNCSSLVFSILTPTV